MQDGEYLQIVGILPNDGTTVFMKTFETDISSINSNWKPTTYINTDLTALPMTQQHTINPDDNDTATTSGVTNAVAQASVKKLNEIHIMNDFLSSDLEITKTVTGEGGQTDYPFSILFFTDSAGENPVVGGNTPYAATLTKDGGATTESYYAYITQNGELTVYGPGTDGAIKEGSKLASLKDGETLTIKDIIPVAADGSNPA